MSRKVVNLMIGPPMHGRGGVSAVIKNIFATDFSERNNLMQFSVYLPEANKFLMILYFLGSIFYLILLISRYSILIAHVHMASRGSYFRKSFIIRLLKLFRIKIILHLHGAEFNKFYEKECRTIFQKHIKSTFMMVDKVIVLSSQWFNWADHVFPNTSHFSIVHNTVLPISTNGLSKEIGKIIFLGRLGDRKGVSDLLYAFKLVNAELPYSILYLGGDGDSAKYHSLSLDLGISESVVFMGWVSGEGKSMALETADVFCLPSYNEGFPMGVIEAMSIGVPVVSTFVGGIPDAITNGVDGLLVDAGDRESLASALINIIRDRELNDRLSKASKQKFDSCFSQHAVIPKLQAIYDDLLTHKQ